MNTSLESIVAAFGILLWMITGTITYWLICNADDKATCETNTAGDNSKVWQK